MLHVKAVSVQTQPLFSLSPRGRGCPEGAREGERQPFFPSPPTPLPQGERGAKHNLRSRGFTLVELLVIVAVVAILAAIAYPSYFAFLQRTHRTDATRALMEAGAAMERYFSQRQTYVGATLGGGSNPVYSSTSPEQFYTLSFAQASTATAYWLVATPVGSQASDKCGNFTYNSLSVRGVSGTLAAQTCWRMK